MILADTRKIKDPVHVPSLEGAVGGRTILLAPYIVRYNVHYFV
jgi:hypothetical protein